MRLVVLASGRGSNFAAIARAAQNGQLPQTEILELISNNPAAPALALAEEFKIPHLVISAKDRNEFEVQLLARLEKLRPDYICLAGYMRLLGENFLSRWKNRTLNIHPSLLPAFKGLHAIEQAMARGVKYTGCTVHFITEEMDEGTILAQRVIAIAPEDTAESLAEKLRPLEHEAYVSVLQKLAKI